jgi:hypothetical protein
MAIVAAITHRRDVAPVVPLSSSIVELRFPKGHADMGPAIRKTHTHHAKV